MLFESMVWRQQLSDDEEEFNDDHGQNVEQITNEVWLTGEIAGNGRR